MANGRLAMTANIGMSSRRVFAESRKSDLYNHIVYESMDHNEFNSEKIIKKIAKEVVIDSAFKKSGAKIY